MVFEGTGMYVCKVLHFAAIFWMDPGVRSLIIDAIDR